MSHIIISHINPYKPMKPIETQLNELRTPHISQILVITNHRMILQVALRCQHFSWQPHSREASKRSQRRSKRICRFLSVFDQVIQLDRKTRSKMGFSWIFLVK
jgi:hypothetical protein